MDSYFRAAVCDLDKLLDEFEQSTDECDCLRAPPGASDPKHRSLPSPPGCLQRPLPAPGLPKDTDSCPSPGDTAVPGHAGASDALRGHSALREHGVAGPDLLSTLDSEAELSCPRRGSVPVCDLVSDTAELIHAAAARQGAQGLQQDGCQCSQGSAGLVLPCTAVTVGVAPPGCRGAPSTEHSDGHSVLQGPGRPTTEEINRSALNSDGYAAGEISDPCKDQPVKCREVLDQPEQTAHLDTECVPVASQSANANGPKDERACEKLPCDPVDDRACSAIRKETHQGNAIGKVDPKDGSDAESMPSDLPKRHQVHKTHAMLPGNCVLPGSSCQTEGDVELEKKITEDDVHSEELNSSEILSSVSSSCVSAEVVQTSLSCLPVSVCGSLVLTEGKVSPLPQNAMAEVISDAVAAHAGRSKTDPSGRESCENTAWHEQEEHSAEISRRTVEDSGGGEQCGAENETEGGDSQQSKAFGSAFLDLEVEPYGGGVDSFSDESTCPVTDFAVEEDVIRSDILISDAELDDFLYGQSLQSKVFKSSDNDSNLIEDYTDEGNITDVNSLGLTDVAAEFMQTKLEGTTSINSHIKASLPADCLEPAAESGVSRGQEVTESGSDALGSDVHTEGARPKQLLGLSQGAAGQKQPNRTNVLERENQEHGSVSPEVPFSGSSVSAGKSADPGESSAEAGGSQTSENTEPPIAPAALPWKQPLWVPDSEAPNCMSCQVKFTFTKRRHHCRACGKVFCGGCCKRKCKLQYMEKEARVCTGCYDDINKGLCPREQRRVWFADGILPNGEVADTTKLSSGAKRSSQDLSPMSPDVAANPEEDSTLTDVHQSPKEEINTITGMKEPRPSEDAQQGVPGHSEGAPCYKSITPGTEDCSAAAEAAESPSSAGDQTAQDVPVGPSSYRALCGVEKCVRRDISLLPDGNELPPLLLALGDRGKDPVVEEHPSHQKVTSLLGEGGPAPLTFILNANLLVNVRLMTCSSERCWCFCTNGLHGLGQAEIIILLQCLPEEDVFPREILKLFLDIYKDAMKGRFIRNMENITFTENFLSSKEHGGFLFVSPIFQKLDAQILPDKPFLCGILIHKLEIPWAKVFPIRLMLRLGAEYGAYPTPVVSYRHRKPLFGEIGHTIMNLLVDLRNYQYTLHTIDNLFVHVEMGRSCIKIPLRKYNEVMKVINSSNEHVISIGASFNTAADSHLVCVQNKHGLYHTQAISATGRPRKVTGASFVVFNGALKTSSGFLAKSSIVEDGLMVQITRETMEGLRQALRDKKDFRITCGKADTEDVKEYVDICWVESEERTNTGILSSVDGKSMEGTQSEKAPQGRDFRREGKVLKCTEVYYFVGDHELPSAAPHHFAKEIGTACSSALCPHLATLKSTGMNKIGLRVSIDSDMVEYLAGSGGHLLPQNYLNDLDSALIPVIHGGMSDPTTLPLKMELIFFITEHLF
ncbi:zinc finger FYVE domain-containing protein 16 isoform X2 [Pithys albifrons albifrons]|uniref:zinc finger FYVE domain-containing protein 16 isoform X2 n=1 Tax=Pithys albifrons albifrons TaxID=3385563 RepID=UPI003A5CED1E